MICERCGTVFCWDGADEVLVGGPRKRYCDDICAKKASKARPHRIKVQLRMCSERPKPGYATREAALQAAAQLQRIPTLHPYECPCGFWHLTSEPPDASWLEGRLRRERNPGNIPDVQRRGCHTGLLN
jgi:hypothetical protein